DLPQLPVPITMHVLGSPTIVVTPTQLTISPAYVGYPTGEPLLVSNSGTADLLVSAVSAADPTVTVSPTTFIVPPDSAQSVLVTATPIVSGVLTTTLTVSSNAPLSPTRIVTVVVTAVDPPVLVYAPTAIEKTLESGQTQTVTVTISNTGAADLAWSLSRAEIHPSEPPMMFDFAGISPSPALDNNQLPVRKRRAGIFPLAPGDFTLLANSPVPLTCLAVDPNTSFIYAQGNYDTGFYRYDPATDLWTGLASAPLSSGNNGGAAYLNGKIYTVYTNNSTQMGVYDIAGNTWNVISNGLGDGTGNITTDGNRYLYLVSDVVFRRYDTITDIWTDLAAPPTYFELWGALVYLDGFIYGHQGNGEIAFARYDVAANSWTALPSLPDGAVLGGAIDPVDNVYYTYGNYGGNNWYAFDLTTETWSVTTVPFINVDDGGLVHVGASGISGIYIIEGENGTGFARLETSPYFGWLALDPLAGVLSPQAATQVTVTLDATALFSNTYYANILIDGNAPATPRATLPVTMHVTADALPVAVPAQLDFGGMFVGYTSTLPLLIENQGLADLVVTDVTASDPAISTTPVSFATPPLASQSVMVTFSPIVSGTLLGTLTLTTNSALTPLLTVGLSGEALGLPVAHLSPAVISETLISGNSRQVPLLVSNTGESDLAWDLTAVSTVSGTAGMDYVLSSSNEAGGPAFNWMDIAGTGTPIFGLSDDNYVGPFPIGFDFTYFGETYTEFYVGSNGFIGFGPPTYYDDLGNTPLPDSGDPNNIIAWLWDDLHPRAGTIHYQNVAGQLVIQFTNYSWFCCGGDAITAEIILRPTGNILIQYLTFTPSAPLTTNTIGIENQDGSLGLQAAYNQALVQPNLALSFSPRPNWLDLNPANGNTAMDSATPITVTLNATNLLSGTYDAHIQLLSNDPVTPLLTTPLTLTVIGQPHAVITPTLLDFGAGFTGYTRTLTFTVTNTGSEDLRVFDITADSAELAASPTSFVLPLWGGSQVVTVVYGAENAGILTATLTLTTNNPITPILTLPVNGSAIDPPIIAVTPAAVSATLPIHTSRQITLTLANNGGSNLNWVINNGQALQFDGNDYVATGLNIDQGSGSPGLTLEAWAYPTSTSSGRHHIISSDNGGHDWSILHEGGVWYVFTGENARSTGFTVDLNTWQHVAAVFQPGIGVTFYKNDQSVLIPYFSTDTADNNIRIGGNPGFGEYFTGQIDEARVWSGVRTPAQIINNLYIPLNGDEPGLLGYWPCNEGFGPTTADASGHGYTGNIVGATWVATDIPGWVIVEPLNGLLAPLASTPLTLTLDAQYLISGTYPTALHILSNDPAVPRFTLPITLTVIEAGPVDLLASTIVVTPTMAIADGVDTIAISGTLRDGAGLPVSERSIGLQVGGSGNLIAPAPLISSTLEGGISFTLAATGAGPRSLALYDAAYGAALTLTNVTFITPAQPSLAAAPTTLLADGLQTALITVTLRNTAGDPLPGEIVSLRFLSGTYSLLNGVVVTGANWIDIGAADVGGVATATLASTRAEVKHLAARGETVSAPETVTVTFLADTAMQAQLLLPGETATPGILPGQAGTPAAVTAGAPFTFTLQAVDAYWNPVPITGTLQLTVSDPLADMPATVDLVAGTAMVSATLRLAGSHVITATPTNQPWPVAMSQPLPVQAAPATSLTLDILSSTQLLDPVDAAVTLYDPFGNVAGSYTGQVLFSSSDAQATLPTPYTFAPTDGGAHTFSGGIRFRTPGPQTITVTDSVQPSLLATATLTVSDQVVISNDTTWNESAVALDSLTVLNNAILTLQGATTITANNVIIDTGAAISANGQGYGAAAGPGAGENGGGPWNQAGGAGHGGWGGAAEHPGGAPYDKVYQPRESGSGGGSSGGDAGGAGGGAIHLVVADTLTISGTLSSNGLSAGYGGFDAGGGGAGGAIWLDANTLTGGGSIQASGGDGGTTSLGNAYGRGGGGAGGRVAVYAGIDDYTGAFQLHGGGGSQYGGPGTLYRQNQDLLRVDNAGHNGQSAGLLTGAYHFTAIQLTGYGHLHLPDPGSILTLTNGTAGGDGTARLSSSGLVIGDADMLISGVTLAIQGDLLGANSITTQSSGGLELSASTPWRSGVYTFTTVTIGGGTTLKAVNYNNGNTDYNDDYGLTLVASELTIAEGAAFTADGQGYGSTSGPGAGAPGGGPWDQAGGGGHGGWGHNAEHPGGAPYGDLYQPLDLGSGGGYSGGRAGGAGGGAVHLIVANTLAISGTLSSNGISGGFGGFDGAGGGSGGSLWIEAGVLQGGGSIRANGGDGGTTTLGNAYGRGGGGGGGRIAVYAAVDTFTGSYSVNAGDAGTCPAVCLGTLYFNGIDPLNSSLILAPDALVADGVSAATITVTLRARDGAPLAGEGVELRATPGNNAHINGQPAVGYVYVGDSDSNGVVTAVITSTKVGLHVLDARGLRGELLQQTATVTFTVGPVDADASQLTTNKSNVIADGLDAATLTVTLTDAQANPLAGEEVHLQATGVDITVTQPVTLTDAAGQLQATVRSTTAQSSQVTALVVGEGITLTDVVNLSFTPAPANAANSTIIITPTQAAANGSSVITITATLRDILNRPLANRAIQIQVTGNNNVIHPSTTQNTDATGQVAFTLASSTAQAKQISLRDLVGNVTLVGGTVTFLPTPLDPNRSDINILGARTAAADGQHALTLIATARDANGNAIPDLPVVFTTNAPVNLAQPNYPTDPSGRALGSVSSSEIGAFTIGVTIDGLALNKTVTVSFIGPDLHVTQSGPAQATVGYPLAYDVTVKNEGLMPASTTLISDTLPNYTTFVTQTSPYPFTYYTTTRTIVWQVGPLPVGQSANLHLETLVDNNAPLNSTVYNTVVAQAAEPELDTADNTASSPTVLKAPQPNMVISSLYPSLVVPEGLTRTLVLTISNEGTANLISATILPPPHLPWVTVTPQQLGNLAPGDVVTATIIADASQVGVNGHYRDRLQVTTANAGTQNVFLTAQVQAPLRNLHLQLSNDLEQNVINAHVILVETIYVETEGVPGSSSYYYENDTDATGQITFNSLETGQAYEYTITAASHDAANGYVYVETGANAQEWSLVLQGQPGLRLEPAAITFNMYRGELAQQILTIRNTGAAPLSDISLAMQNIPFIYLGEPAVGTVLNPGQAVEVTVNAAPPITETIDIYQGTLTVDASGGQSQSIPVTVNIRDQLARTLCARVETDSGAPLTQATLRLTDLAGKIIATGPITDTIQQAYVQSSDQDGPGYSCFADLTPGPYYLEVGRGDILLGDKNIAVVPGDGIQEELIIVDEPAVIAKWSVTPTEIEDVYTTVFTLTFIPHQVPRLSFSPDRINLCGDDDGVVTQEITVHNFYPITLTNAVLTWQTQGNVSASVSGPNGPTGGGSIGIGELPPNSHTPFLLTVSTDMQTCSGDEGLVLINVEAEYQHFIPETWYRIDATPGLVQPGQQAHIPLKLVNTGYPEESNLNGIPPTMEDITIVPPQNLNWITVSTTLIDSLEVGEEIGFDLIVEPPQWLAEGFYYDYIQIYATNGITTLIGIEAEMTPGGLRVETQFVTPLTAGEGGAPPPPPPGEPPPQYGQETPPWDDIVTQWNPDIFGPNEVIVGNWQILVGCYCAQPVGEWYPVGNALVHVVTGAPGPGFAFSPDFKENVVILQLEQRFSLDRQAFTADLDLGNGLASELTDVEVSIVFQNGQGEIVPVRLPEDPITPTGDFTPTLPLTSIVPAENLLDGTPGRWQKIYPANFIIVPETPTALPNLPSGQNYFASWTIIPDAPGLTELGYFDVYAIIRYKVNGVQKELITSPAPITVEPQPRIVLDYYLPNYVLGSQTFDWLVVATNIGYGTARNFRVETPQPKIIKQSEVYPTNFTLIGPSVLNWGDVAPGQQVSGVWRLLPSEPGSFVDWEAECKHDDYKGVELPELVYCTPRVHFYDTSYLAESQQWGKGDSCLSGLFQGFDSDPVNTFSGNFTYSTSDVNIPSWGPALELVRSYNSRDTEDGPFGPGWTHNFNLDLTYESFIGLDQDGIIGQQTYFAARLPHGSIIYFNVSPDGNTITPFPGVKATLTRELTTYTLTQACDQTVYTYNAEQKLTSVEDPNGNRLTMSYDQNGNLTAVTDDTGRPLTFTYDANGHVTQMTDPLGRSYTYSYSLGYLAQVEDFRGQVTHYTYSLPTPRQPGQLVSRIDPNGHQEFVNHYDENYRLDWQDDALGNRTLFGYNYDANNDTRTTLVTDPLGNTSTDRYDSEGRLISRHDALGNAETYGYDNAYNVNRVTDANGHTTLYDWDDCNCNITQLVDPMGNTTTMTVNGQKLVTSVTNERGYTTSMAYDSHTNRLAVTDPLGGTKSYTYGPHGETLSETDENGHTAWFGYDAFGNTTVITDALGQTTRMAYDVAGRLLQMTDALGRTTTYVYDAGDNVLQTTNGISATTVFAYDNAGNLLSITDPLGRNVSYEYDPRNDLIRTTNPLGGVQTYAYDANGNLITQANANGRATTHTYDPLNRRIQTTNPLSGTVSSVYDPVGNLLAETDANGNVTQYVYDANDRVVRTIFPDGSEMTSLYDQADNLLQLTNGAGGSVSFTYDALGRTLTKTDPELGVASYVYDPAGNQIHMTDAEGRQTSYTYDALNRLVSVTDPAGYITSFGYDAVGNQTGATDGNGHTMTIVYDDANRIVQRIDPRGGITRYSYDLVGNRTRVVNPLGSATRTSYDALNRPLTVTNALSGTVSYLYDGVGNILQVTDEEGNTRQYAYDALDRKVSMTDALGGVTTMAYDANGNLLTQTDPLGRTTQFAYDVFNQVLTRTNPLGGTTVYVYDAVGNVLQATNPNGQATQFSYDGLDRMIAAIDANAGITLYAYDKVGNLTQQTDPEGNAVATAYDLLNRPVAVTDALGHASSYAYDAVGNLIRMTDAEGRQTTYAYDELNRLVQLTDPLGQVTQYAYDAIGNQVSLVDALGRESTFAFDKLNRLVRATNSISGTTVYTYTAAGNLHAAADANGQQTTYIYDTLYRPIHTIDPLGQVLTTTYDAVGNPLAITDVAGRTTQFTYDGLNRLVQAVNPLGGVQTMAYDPIGNRIQSSDENGHAIHYSYDALNRLVAITDPLAHLTTFTYDRVGNQLTLTDPLSRTTGYAYDAAYRLLTITDPLGQQSSYSYDAVGNILASADAAGRTTQFTYDGLNRVIQMTNPLSGTMQFTYDAVGNQTSVTDAAGHVIAYAYDGMDRLTRITNPLNQVTSYAYDPLGNLLAQTDALNRTTRYDYDALNRMVMVTDPLSATMQFEYDPVGNMVRQVDRLQNPTQYTVDALNRVVAMTDALNQTTSFAYDPVGNLLQVTNANGATSQMAYDALNRLVSQTNPLGHTTQYSYDAIGNNTAVIDPLGHQTSFVYDPLDRMIGVTDALNRTTGYLYDPVGNQVGMTDAEGVETRYQYDALNRLTQVTENYVSGGPQDAETNVVNQFSYDPVGNLIAATNPLGNSFTYSYDALNRMVQAADPLGYVTQYNYDPVGNLAGVMDPNQTQTSYVYDDLNRLTTITRPDETVSFTYDAMGNRLTMSDLTGLTSYSYDAIYRLTVVTDPLLQTVQYGYDSAGNRTSLTYPDDEQVTYGYDGANRLLTVTDWDGGETSYTYDEAARLVEVVLPNGITGTFGYDDANQLTLIQYNSLTQTLGSYVYAYDQAGNRIQVVELQVAAENVPTAVFTATERVGVAPLTVTFYNGSIYADTFVWEFGDGQTLTTTSMLPLTHTYDQPGLYTVRLTAANA
ncbi:MAG: Ig-like domain-containing protein, partial [Anaerolineales bacterium]|nr:Ig-like domain-containing protein [Anaerolineales bacterium]